MANIIDGKQISKDIKEELKAGSGFSCCPGTEMLSGSHSGWK